MSQLPPETLSIVFGFANRGSLFDLCLCNKSFYEIAIPYLYKSIDLSCDHMETPIIGFRPLTCFLLRKPWVAKNVKHLSIRYSWEDSRERPVVYEDPRDPEPEIKDAIEDTAQSDEEKAKWLEDARLPVFEDCIMPLFLAQLTNLETLDMEIPMRPQYVTRQLERVGRREHPYDKKPTLQNLRSIMAAFGDNKYGLEPEHVAWIFYLPRIRDVYLHRFGSPRDDEDNEDGDERGSITLPKRTSTCRSIEIRDCKLTARDLTNLLHSCERVETFGYEIGEGFLSEASLDWPAIRDALAAHKETLRDMRLEQLDHGNLKAVPSFDDDLGPMESLKDFPALKRVEIDTFFLFGLDEDDMQTGEKRLAQFLPRNIVDLKITHADENPDAVVQNLNVLLAQKDTEFQELARVFIRCDEDCFSNRDLKTLSQTAEGKGVQLKAEHWLIPEMIDEEVSIHEAMSQRPPERKWGFDGDVEWLECSSGCNRGKNYAAYDL